MIQKDEIQTQIKKVKHQLDGGTFHPSKGSVLNVKPALRQEIKESLQAYTLSEFLSKTTQSGATYLVPDVIHMQLIGTSQQTDKVPLFAAQVVNGWKGGNLLVNIAVRTAESTLFKWTIHPQQSISGAQSPMVNVKTTQATLKPVQFSVTPVIGNDLIEDNNFDLVSWHTDEAARQIGQYATDLAIADLKAASDGDGAQCVVAAGSDTTLPSTIEEAYREVGSEFHNPNVLITTHEAWGDAIGSGSEVAGGAAGDYYRFAVGTQYPSVTAGYDAKFQMLDVIFNNSKNLHAGVTTGKMTDCISLVLDRNRALLCGRKRWMQIENYSSPVVDLANMTITCRQDCVTLYKDASCEITET